MASVHRVKKSKYWFGSVSLPGGKRLLRSTGQTEKGKALAVALEWERVAKGRPHSQEQARKVLADILVLVGGGVNDSGMGMTCRQYVTRWLAARKGTVAQATYDFSDGTLRDWLTWLGDRADAPVDRLQRETIVEWRNAEAKRVSTQTANLHLKAVRHLLKDAVKDGFAMTNAAADVDLLKRSRKDEPKIRRPFTLEELRAVESAADEEWRLLLWLGFYTGQRLGDLLRLRADELDLKKMAALLETRKTGLKVWIPLPASLVKQLEEWRAKQPAGPWIFPEQVAQMSKTSGKPIAASKKFANLLFRAGLREHTPYGSGRGKGPRPEGDRRQMHPLSFHCLRHTARTFLEESGVPVAVIDALVGHHGEQGRAYTKIGTEALRKAASVLETAGAAPGK